MDTFIPRVGKISYREGDDCTYEALIEAGVIQPPQNLSELAIRAANTTPSANEADPSALDAQPEPRPRFRSPLARFVTRWGGLNPESSPSTITASVQNARIRE